MPQFSARTLLVGLLILFLVGCLSNPTHRSKVHETDEWVIQLNLVDDANQGHGYDHPATLSPHEIAQMLDGLYIDYEPRSLPFLSDSHTKEVERSKVFSEDDSATLASMLVDGLEQATKTDIVTFTQTTPISSRQERVTSGGVFIAGDEFNVVISNHGVKQDIWQDVETYQAPVYLDPLNPITSQPGRLVFHHRRLMRIVPNAESDFVGMWTGINWHIAIKYKALNN